MPDDDSPGTHCPFFDQPVDDVRVSAREVFGNGFVAAVKNNQGGVGGFSKGAGKNNFAAIRSRLGDNINSMVSPAESTARYRYAQFPATFIYVSSTLHDAERMIEPLRPDGNAYFC